MNGFIIEVRDFYKTTLLSPSIPVKVKADMALDIAGRWEQIDQSSSALSTSYTHSQHSNNELTGGVRSVSGAASFSFLSTWSLPLFSVCYHS